MNEMVVKEYLGNGIEFKVTDGQVYANATSMCKPFGKLFADWKRLKQTEDMILEVSEAMGIPIGQLVIVENGKGSWIHEELVLELSGWLAVKFRRWCQSQITTLLREGSVSLTSQYKLPTTFKEALIMLVEAEEIKEKLLLENSTQKDIIEIQTPKAEYFDALVESNLLTNFRDTAKELKVKESVFIEFLLEKGYVYRDTKKKLKPTAKYVPSLFEIKEYVSGGHSGNQTKITPKGRESFRLLLDKWL